MILESASSRRSEVYRFRFPVLISFPLLALVLQTYLPLHLDFATLLNLPLLMVIYFSLARRNPADGLLAGAVVGVAQDSLARDPIGVMAIAGTVAGYVTSSISSRMDTDNPGLRFIIIFLLYWLHTGCLYLVDATLVGNTLAPALDRSVIAALVNAVLGVLLFIVLDSFRKPVE